MQITISPLATSENVLFIFTAGHTDAVRILLQDFKGIRIDQPNRLGMTALMKAAIQGRSDCSRLLLYAGMLVASMISPLGGPVAHGQIILVAIPFRWS